jgi:hypothetical protein
MRDIAFLKTVLGAVICGVGVTSGLVLSRFQGGSAWLVAGILVLSGVAIAAIPAPSRRTR